ncbi:unnamed protein product [Leptosia nina]|uniref:Peptidase S1 domain-containing protein n=1 Tax=Leptosia nina TaxID=320188 RepID=A0AAV1JLK5_9NEOP
MKKSVILCALLSSVIAFPSNFNYHKRVGIPFATRLKQIELASDFDGSRIIGGDHAPLGAYPHMAGLVIPMPWGDSACGASLISHTRALTAAHCWEDGATVLTVVLGSTTLFYGGVRVNSSTVINHEGWNPRQGLEHDIAVIVMPWVGFNDIIQPINLHTGSNHLEGAWVTVAGYGITRRGASLEPNQSLKHFTTQIISNEECSAKLGPFVTDRMVCTRSGPNKDNPCNSDSGGPLSLGTGSRGVLIGVVSFGSINCEAGHPAAFAKVSYYIPWIRALL